MEGRRPFKVKLNKAKITDESYIVYYIKAVFGGAIV